MEQPKAKDTDVYAEVMEHCRKCDSISQCRQPCGLAKAILAIHGLEYQG